MTRILRATAAVAALAVLLALAATVFAHGEGITVTPGKAAPGDKVTVKGEDWDDSPVVAISLKGQDLGKIQADDDGGFTIEVTIPASMTPGSYEITATNPEGEKATADLQITSAAAMAAGDKTAAAGATAGTDKAASDEAMAGSDKAAPAGTTASADKAASDEASKNVEWRVNNATTPAERAGAGALIVVAALAGFGLVLSARQKPRTA